MTSCIYIITRSINTVKEHAGCNLLQITLNKMDYPHGSYLRLKAPDLLTKLTKGCVDQPICGCERDNTRVKKAYVLFDIT
jgi:hypothetical protein